MAKYVWATDIHLDLLGEDNQRLIQFGESLVRTNPTGIFLTGDISTARKLVYHLSALDRIAKRPIFFVLGNHDYWDADTTQVRKAMKELTNVSPFLRYMPTMLYQAITPSTAVVGHDCWYDAGAGNWQNSNMVLQDWKRMGDYVQVNKNKATIVATSRKLAHEGVQHIHNGIKAAARYHKNIIVLTHFPPFAQSHVHEGHAGSVDAMPWYVNHMMGQMLMDASKAFDGQDGRPKVHFNVLCGHTHGTFNGNITPNLEVHVGGAEYGAPGVAGIIEIA